MKKLIYPLIPVLLIVFFNSCAPVYKCGDYIPYKTPFTWSKNLKAVVSERDMLCEDLATRQKENAGLKNDITARDGTIKDLNGQLSSLTALHDDLQNRYNSLIDKNISQTEQYNRMLKAKSDELDEKERLLIEREKTLIEMQGIIARQDSITRRLNSVLRNALLGFASDELSVEIRNGKVYVSMSDKLLFKSGSAAVETKGVEALKVLGDVLNKNTDIDILVEGHTDNVPIRTSVYRDNWDLSVARATSIVRILSADYKVDPTRLTASGKGEYYPRAGNDTAEGRASNRRTEIILSPKLEEIMQLIKI